MAEQDTADEVIAGLLTTIGAMIVVAGGEITIPRDAERKGFTITATPETYTFTLDEEA